MGFESQQNFEVEGEREVFMNSLKTRLVELVQEGRMPKVFAEYRLKAGEKIENGINDPENQGVRFAEIGLEALEHFYQAKGVVEDLIGHKINSPFEEEEQLMGEVEKLGGISTASKESRSIEDEKINATMESGRRALDNLNNTIKNIGKQ